MTKKKEQFDILKEKMIQFLKERDWEKFHTPKNVAMSIAIEAAELMEKKKTANMQPGTVAPGAVQQSDEMARKGMTKEQKLTADIEWAMRQVKEGKAHPGVRSTYKPLS